MNKSTISAQEFIDIVAAEVSAGVCFAVESWMAQVEHALNDPRLSAQGRMDSVKKVVNHYRCMTRNHPGESRSLQGAVR